MIEEKKISNPSRGKMVWTAIILAAFVFVSLAVTCGALVYLHSQIRDLRSEIKTLKVFQQQIQNPVAEKVTRNSFLSDAVAQPVQKVHSRGRRNSGPSASNQSSQQIPNPQITNTIKTEVQLFMRSMLHIVCAKEQKLCLPGPKGDKGDPGAHGLLGPSGVKGDQGRNGTKGDQGANGTPGTPGTVGPVGPPGLNGTKGERGHQGLSVSAPSFIVSPKSLTVLEKQSASFQCKVDGLPIPDVAWSRASEILPLGRHVIGSDGSLSLSNVSFADRGTYTCVGRSILGSTSAKAKLVVEVPTRFDSRPSNQVVEEGKKAELTCKARGHPTPIITWSRHQGTLPPNRHKITKNRLTINNIRISDGGVYTCSARNKLKHVRASANLMVVSRLKFTVTPPKKETTVIGKTVSLQCEAESGVFKPIITWSKKHGSLPSGAKVLSNGKLIMKISSPKDGGTYVCTAKNMFASIAASTVLEFKSLRSCSQWRKARFSKSQSYTVDPDGVGGVSAFSVFCDMTDKGGVGVTVIGHDSEARTVVVGYEAPGSYSKNVKYFGVNKAQLLGLILASQKCEQFIKYQCKSSMFYFGSGNPDGWWVSRDGQKMNYWGGATPGSGKCACGMTNTCATKGEPCNCDSNDSTWREDSGLLTDKSTLPVSQLRFGDTGDAEKGYHTLGKLKCYGTV